MLQIYMLKKIVFGQLVTKENGIDCKIPIVTGLVNKLQYDTDKQILEKMIEDVDQKTACFTVLVEKTDQNTKTTEIEKKISSTTGTVKKLVMIQKFRKLKKIVIQRLVTKTNLSTKLKVNEN